MPNTDVSRTQAVTSQPGGATASVGVSSGPHCGRVSRGPPRRSRVSTLKLSSLLSGGVHAKRVTVDRAGGLLDRVVSTRLARGDRSSVGNLLSSLRAEIDGVLRPFIGPAGVDGLFARSLRAAARSHDWLADLADSTNVGAEADRMTLAFDARERGEATAAGLSLMRAFCDVLRSAVGASLAERLLQPILATATSGSEPRPDALTQSM